MENNFKNYTVKDFVTEMVKEFEEGHEDEERILVSFNIGHVSGVELLFSFDNLDTFIYSDNGDAIGIVFDTNQIYFELMWNDIKDVVKDSFMNTYYIRLGDSNEYNSFVDYEMSIGFFKSAVMING